MNPSQNTHHLKSTAYSLVAGSLSGIVQISLTYPIKFIKTQMQLEEKFGDQKMYKGMFDVINKTVKEFGILGLYRGLNVFAYGARSAVSFSTFQFLKGIHANHDGTLSPGNRLLCGLYAGAFEAALINTPLETIECRLVHDRRLGKHKYKGFTHGAVTIFKESGIRSFYTGLLPAVLKQSGNQGTRFFVVETCKNTYQKGDPAVPVPKLFVGMFGMVAGFCSVFITNPIDVIKTRMQGLDHDKFKGMIDCGRHIAVNEGLYSFYRGLSPRLYRVCLEVSLTFMMYDVFIDLIKKK